MTLLTGTLTALLTSGAHCVSESPTITAVDALAHSSVANMPPGALSTVRNKRDCIFEHHRIPTHRARTQARPGVQGRMDVSHHSDETQSSGTELHLSGLLLRRPTSSRRTGSFRER